MKITLKFTCKTELQFFLSCISDMLRWSKLEFIDYYNAVDLFKILQRKNLEVAFSERKKFSLKISPNHFTAFNALWSDSWKHYQAGDAFRYNFCVQMFEQAKRGFERVETSWTSDISRQAG